MTSPALPVRRLVPLVSVVSLVLVSLPAPLAETATAGAGGAAGITARDLRAHVKFLADDALRGRETGEPGVARAEQYIADKFASYGLQPLPGQSGHFVDYGLYRRSWDLERTRLVIGEGNSRIEARPGVDFRPFDFSSDGKLSGEVVFAGYGITAPEHAWDDYAGLDVEGKLVLVLRHEPNELDPDSPFEGLSSSEHALFATKAANARRHGARAMLLVTDPLNHDPGDDMRIGGALSLEPLAADYGGEAEDELLAAQITRELAASLVTPGGTSLAELQRAVDAGRPVHELGPRGVEAELAVHRRDEAQRVPARNVAGFLAGSDPRLKHQWIVIGGHHDHIGGFAGEGDTIFNGADDNASGTSAVLELAQAFAGLKPAPRRSMVFVTFSGEEKGLLGSRALVDGGVLPMERLVFMLNLDMIGRNPTRPVQVIGDGFVAGLKPLVRSARGELDLKLDFAGASYAGNSDHHAFYRNDVPFLFFFTGTHPDYHRPGDHPAKLAYPRMESIARLSFEVLHRLAHRDTPPRFIHNVDWLGLRVQVEDRAGGAAVARVIGVDSDSRAALAGFHEGDVVAGFGEQPLEDPAEVGRRFRAIEPGDTATLIVERDDQRHELSVQRAKTGYLGIMPGRLDEDLRQSHNLPHNQGLVLQQVVAGGPAAQGGLQDGDILLTLDGQLVGPGNLRSRLTRIGAGERVKVVVLRGGERVERTITLGERPRRMR